MVAEQKMATPTPEQEEMEVDAENPAKLQQALEKKEEGNKEYSAKNYKAAINLYTEAITLHPECAAYYGNRAAAYMMTRQYISALEDARTSTTKDPTFIKGYLRTAKCYIATGQPESAKKALDRAHELDRKNKAVLDDLKIVKLMIDYEMKGADAYQAKDYRRTEFCMRKLVELAPDSANYKGLQAECLALSGKYGDAQLIANDILRTDEQNAEALYVRGLCLYYQDQTERAYKLFQQLLRLSPDFKKAKDAYKRARNLENTKAKGNEAFKQAKYTEALQLYTEALTVDPLNITTNAKLYCNRATVNSKLNRNEDCIADCTKAIELDAAYLKAYLRRAKCYMDTEQYEEAVRDYEKITKMDRSNEYRQMLKEAKLELKKSQRKDYYKILGVPKTATEEEIKKAYKKEALKHHPDRHGSATDEVKKKEEILFKEAGEAYAVLSDSKKKHRYDTGQDLEESMGMGDFDPNIIFQTFFGGGGGGFRQQAGGHSHGGGMPGGFTFTFG